jgi:hypothetical protein
LYRFSKQTAEPALSLGLANPARTGVGKIAVSEKSGQRKRIPTAKKRASFSAG